MTTDQNAMVPIPYDNWPHLMEMYKINWPTNFVTFYTIKNFIDWKNFTTHDKEIEFYSLNGDWNDGTHLIIDKSSNHVFFNTLNPNYIRLSELLQLLPITKETCYLFVFTGKFENIIMEFLNKNNLYDNGGNSAYLYYLNKDKALQFDVRPPDGFSIKPLEEKHAKLINDVWKYKHKGSEDYIRKLIKRNLHLGVFDENDSPVSWCFRVEYGLLGTLQTLDSHKTRGFGELIVKALAKLSAENGLDSGASMALDNIPSQNLFEKVGFERIGKLIYVYPKFKLNKVEASTSTEEVCMS